MEGLGQAVKAVHRHVDFALLQVLEGHITGGENIQGDIGRVFAKLEQQRG